MAGTDNLIPVTKRSKEEAREMSRKGGIASGETRRKKKEMKDLAKLMLESKTTEAQAKNIASQFPDMNGEDITMSAVMVAGQIKAAINGNTKAFNALQELSERARPDDEGRLWTLPINDITTDFVEPYRTVHEAYETGDVREVISKGGRGSIKSNFWSAIALETILQDKQAHVVMTRRYKTDLRGSVYNQFVKTVTRYDMVDEWEFTTSPMEATRKATGQKVVFVGCDKPISLKSYNFPFGYAKLVINEEADEMAGVEQMDSVEDTFLRNDTYALSVKVFNPPQSVNNFMNKYAEECASKEGTCVFHSYYYNVPVKWLGQRFFDRAKWFKKNKELYYKNNYLGEVTGTGGLIFGNIEERTITDDEIETLENRHYGIDWGFEHPQVFEDVNYDHETDTVTIIKEVFMIRMKQEQFAEEIKDYMNEEIIADSANPDKISDYNDYGFDVIPAKKRWKGGGRAYSWEWLRTRNKIIVDPQRTPHTAKELKTLEFEKLKDGTFSSAYPQLGEDCTMAIIYALNRVISEQKDEIMEEE